MDSEEKEQAFAAIHMAILHGYISAARRAFEKSIETAREEQIDEIIDVIKGLKSNQK